MKKEIDISTMYTRKGFALFAVLVYANSLFVVTATNVYNWLQHDNFDEIMDKLVTVNEENCKSRPKDQLELPASTVTQKPVYNRLLTSGIYGNRSSLLHLHNLALNRAFYFSYMYQKLNNSVDFATQPGLMYLYMSTTADVTGSEGFINGSAVFFDNDCYYPNWLTLLDFNRTIPLFGPRAWRADDYVEPTNWLREPTNNTVDIHDYAAGESNYTNPIYKSNQWYSFWMPDTVGNQDSLRKFTYTVGTKYSNKTGSFVNDEFVSDVFFGPPQPGQNDDLTLPVQWTVPYFDCGRSNRWIVSANSPIVEYMPRYSDFVHLRRPRFVAVVTQDIEFERIDINPCPFSEGNIPPNYFAGTSRCKPTTMCEPLMGWGFRRGGYQCVCQPGYYYPWWHDGPFQGLEIEQATEDEYNLGFDCLPVDYQQVIPNEMPTWVTRKKRSTDAYTVKDRFLAEAVPGTHSPRVKLVAKRDLEKEDIKAKMLKRRFVARYPGETKKIRHKRDLFDQEMRTRMENILTRKYTTNRENCESKPDYQLYLPGDAAYGVEKAFEAQGRTALRLAHFLCDFLQNVDEYETFGSLKGDRRLNETHLFGETLANVMSDFRIMGSGVFFDRYKFRMSPPLNNTDPRFVNGITREFFGPYAWRYINVDQDGLGNYRAEDFAGHKDFYIDKDWFRRMKARWQTNFSALKKYTAKPMIRSDMNGTSLVRFEHYPLTYMAPTYEQGEWLRPQFKCDPTNLKYEDWVSTYVVPFFGTNDLKTHLEFKGVVTVEAKLDYLDINQCPGEFFEANAFKNTARCHFKSTHCVPLSGRHLLKFERGSYKCECRQGYEYPFNDLAWFFDGQTMEEEYEKMARGDPNRYDTLKCRISGAATVFASWLMVSMSSFVILFWNRL